MNSQAASISHTASSASIVYVRECWFLMQLCSVILVVSYTYSPVTSTGLVHLMGLTCLFNSRSYILHCIAIWDRVLKGFLKAWGSRLWKVRLNLLKESMCLNSIRKPRFVREFKAQNVWHVWLLSANALYLNGC